MPSPETSLVVIACPHCGTRYQVDYAAIGAKGRTVACAHCHNSWEAHAEPPRPAVPQRVKDFEELAEEALDEKFRVEEARQEARREAKLRAREAEEAAKAEARAAAVAAEHPPKPEAKRPVPALPPPADDASAVAALIAAAETQGVSLDPVQQRTLEAVRAAIGGKPGTEAAPDPAAKKRQQHEFSQRQRSLYSRLPMARMRRVSRWGSVAALVLVIGGGLVGRTWLVQQFPQLAGAYSAIGLAVNVVGLDFRDLHTLKSLQQGAEELTVSGNIVSVAGGEVTLPQVIVTLTNPQGQALYAWSMVPKATELEPGETLPFETQLTSPPAGATAVRLSFANGRTASRPVAAGADNAPVPDVKISLPAALAGADANDGSAGQGERR